MQRAVFEVGVEHLPCQLRRCAPGLAAEQLLRHPLPGAVAIEGFARRESARRALAVNAAAILEQLRAWHVSGLVVAESLRRIECRSDAAERAAAGAIGL